MGLPQTFRLQVERDSFSQCYQSHWVGSTTTTVTGLLGASPGLHQRGVQEARTGHWKGQHPWSFGRDSYLSGHWQDSEWPTEGNVSLGCNPSSLKEGTETSRPAATAAVPPLSGWVTGSAPQPKSAYALHLLPSYTRAAINGSWMQSSHANVHWLV